MEYSNFLDMHKIFDTLHCLIEKGCVLKKAKNHEGYDIIDEDNYEHGYISIDNFNKMCSIGLIDFGGYWGSEYEKYIIVPKGMSFFDMCEKVFVD